MSQVLTKAGKFITVTFSLTADSSGDVSESTDSGTYGAGDNSKTITDLIKGTELVGAYAIAGTGGDAPTALWDVTATDANGVDLFDSALLNLSATAKVGAFAKIGGIYGSIPVVSALTVVGDNMGSGKKGTVALVFEEVQ